MIRAHVLLRCSAARAFSLFTEQAGAWWPVDRRHTKDAASSIHIEPAGRFFERASTGAEVELGRVRVFSPGERLVLDWFPGTGPEYPTEVEVRFETTDGGTRVTVTHRPGAAGEERFNARAAAYERSWELVLAAWRDAVRAVDA